MEDIGWTLSIAAICICVLTCYAVHLRCERAEFSARVDELRPQIAVYDAELRRREHECVELRSELRRKQEEIRALRARCDDIAKLAALDAAPAQRKES